MNKIIVTVLFLLMFVTKSYAVENPCAKPVPKREDIPWLDRSWEDRVCNGTHDDNYTYQGTAYSLDPYVWVYTKEFAERFHMPAKWIDSDLKGALAVAWRMTTIGDITCGLSGRAQNCWKPLECQMDIYYDNRIKLPWSRDDVVRDNVMRGLSSTDFLYKSYGSRAMRYVDGGVRPLLSGLKHGEYDIGAGADAVLFDKEYDVGIGLMSLVGSAVCPKYTGSDEVYMDFYDKSQTALFFQGKIMKKDLRVVHKIIFPEAFLLRANTVYEQQNKPNQDVIKSLIDNYFRDSK